MLQDNSNRIMLKVIIIFLRFLSDPIDITDIGKRKKSNTK